MFQHMTFDYIISEMLANISSDIDTREGSVIYDALAPIAIEQAQMYINLDVVLSETFGNTASREFLILRAFERGLSPYSATYAIWRGEFNIAVPIGSRFSLDDLNFIVTDTISDTEFTLQCESLGSVGNKNYGTLIPIQYINGLTSASLVELLIPAQDDEDTEVFRSRYINSFSSQAFGGNIADYLEKTNSIDGVGACKVTPCWNGGGTVKLTILDAQLGSATATLIDLVQETIDPTRDASGIGIAPIGHIVTVDTADSVNISISTNITFDTGYYFDNFVGLITSAVEEYFAELRSDWADYSNLIVRIAQIETNIMAIKGIIDICDTYINGDAQNLTLSSNQIPFLLDISTLSS